MTCRFCIRLGLVLLATSNWLLCETGFSQTALPDLDNSLRKDDVCKSREYDFGRVSVGERPVHKFKLHNPTDKVLEIESTSTSCGCAVVDLDEKTINPSESIELAIELRTESFRGKKSSTIQVLFKNPKEEIQFTISANIDPIALSPQVLQLTPNAKGQAEGTIKVSRMGSAYWSIRELKSSRADIDVKVLKKVAQPDSVAYELGVSINAGSEMSGISQEFIYAVTNDSNHPKLEIPVAIGKAQKEIEMLPAVISFDRDMPAPFEKKILVKTVVATELTKVSSGLSWLKVKELKPDKKKLHLLVVTAKSIPESSKGGNIQVATSTGIKAKAKVAVSESQSKAESK